MSEEITAQPAVVTTPPKATTADDLLAMYDEEVQTSDTEVKEEAEKQLAIKEEVPKLEMAKKLADAAKELPDEDSTTEEVEPPPDGIVGVKSLKAKLNEADVEIPEDAVVVQKINGKDVPVKVKDAFAAFTKIEDFNRKMDQRISYATAKEKRFESNMTAFKSSVDKIVDTAQKGDFVSAIRALAKVAAGNSGLDIVKFEQKYFEQLDKVNEIYSKMTPDQRAAFFAKRQAETATEEAATLRAAQEAQVHQQELEQRIVSSIETGGLSKDEFWSAYEYLAQNAVGEGRHFPDPDAIPPEVVVQYAKAVQHERKVQEAGERVGIKDDAILDEISKLTRSHPEFTVEDIVAVVERSGVAKVAPPGVVENLNRKARAYNTASSQVSSAKEEARELDDEDLKFLTRHAPRAYKPIVYR